MELSLACVAGRIRKVRREGNLGSRPCAHRTSLALKSPFASLSNAGHEGKTQPDKCDEPEGGRVLNTTLLLSRPSLVSEELVRFAHFCPLEIMFTVTTF